MGGIPKWICTEEFLKDMNVLALHVLLLLRLTTGASQTGKFPANIALPYTCAPIKTMLHVPRSQLHVSAIWCRDKNSEVEALKSYRGTAGAIIHRAA